MTGWTLMGAGLVVMFIGCLLVTSPWAFVVALGSSMFGGGLVLHLVHRTLRQIRR